MPPKAYKKVSTYVSQSQSSASKKQEEIQQNKQAQQQLFINPKNVIQNSKTLERIRILVSLLSGIIAGLLNVNQILGPVVYLIMHLLISGLIIVKVGDTGKYFSKKSHVFNGIGSGALIFVCAWMIVYNIVYTL